MIELFKRIENGLTTIIEFDVVKAEDGTYIDFVRSEYSDNNKWKNPKVLTDKIIQRCHIYDAYGMYDESGEITRNFILKHFQKDAMVVKEIENMSKHIDIVEISLPTSVRGAFDGRGIKNTFLPLIVKINGEDVSIQFMDFDVFAHRAVDVAYDALINGNIPTPDREIVNFDGVRDLHESFVR